MCDFSGMGCAKDSNTGVLLRCRPVTIQDMPDADRPRTMQRTGFFTRLFVSLLIGSKALAATYYVATTGSDSNAGSQTAPWATQQHAWSTMVPGDTTLVAPGVYTRAHNWDQTLRDGTSSSRITMRVMTPGTVTNMYGFSIANSFVTYDGFIFPYVTSTGPSWLMDGSGNVITLKPNPTTGAQPTADWVQNCLIRGYNGSTPISMLYSNAFAVYGDNGPQQCVISNCTILDIQAVNGLVKLRGMSNLVVNCTMSNLVGSTFFYLFGRSNTVRGCTCKASVQGPGFHPDFIQSYMNGGAPDPNPYANANNECSWMVVEGCYVESSKGSGENLCEFEYYPVPTNAVPPFGHFTIRNNIFNGLDGTAAIDIPDVRFYNNVFRDMGGVSFQLYEPSCWSRLDQFRFPGAATNAQCVGNLFINTPAPTIQVDTNWKSGPYNNVFDWNYYVKTNAAGGWVAGTSALTTNQNYITYTMNANGCIAGLGGYITLISGKWGAHDINTGTDPKLAGGQTLTSYSQFRPMLSSPLIGAGTNLVSADFEGVTRLGTPNDIGAFQFDSSLKLHLDFDEDFTAGKVLDVSGNGNHAWRFQPTNWITGAQGLMGSAAQFTTNGVMANDPGNVYPLSTYLGVTNLSGISDMAKATISVWAKFDPNRDPAIRLLDNGFNATYAFSPSGASNSWALARNYDSVFSFIFYPGSGGITNLITFPHEVIQDQGSNINFGTANWNLYTVTVDCPANQIIGYFNGTPFQTNTLAAGAPSIRIYGTANQRWLCIGAMSHDGTPAWGDDAYPNDGFMEGKMDDVRIYNRALSSGEVKNLYVVGAAAQAQPVPGSPNTTPAPFVTISASPTTLTAGQSTTLTWSSANATTVTLAGSGQVALNGSLVVTPGATTTYTATATGPGGTQTANVTVTVASLGLSFSSLSGTVTAPFTVANSYISQSVETDNPANGGRASYTFNVVQSGDYAISVVANAPNSTNSLFVNIDGEPQDPTMIWDMPTTTGFQTLYVGWRGAGTSALDQFAPKFFTLTAGQHVLIVRGRTPNVQVQSISFINRPAPPTGLVTR